MTVDYIKQSIAILHQKTDFFFDYLCLQDIPQPLEKYVKAILNNRKLLSRQNIHISFFGTFKAGKSTLINAILRERLLPSRANRATGVITRIRYCSQKVAYIAQSGNQNYTQVPYNDFAKYILLDISQGGSNVPQNVKSVEIGLAHPLLRGNRVFIDTPGIRDTPELTKVTFKELAKADLAVMVLKAGQILSEDEKEIAMSVNSLLRGNLVFIINRLDEIDEEEESREEVLKWAIADLQKLKLGNSIVGRPRVYATEAKNTLEARLQSLPDKSNGILKFEKWLDQFLNSPTVCQLVVTSRLGVIEGLLKKFKVELEKELSALRSKIQYVAQKEELAFEQSQNTKRQSILDTQAKVSQCRSDLLEFGKIFVQNKCQELVRDIPSEDPQYLRESEQTIKCDFNKSSSQLISQVNYKVEEYSGQFTPKNTILYELLKVDFVMPPYDSTATWIGASIGALVGLPFGGFASVPTAQFGSYLGSLFSHDDYRAKVIDSINKSGQSLLSAFRSQHNTHFNRIEQEYSNLYQKINEEKYQSSAFLRDLQETERKYISLQIWSKQVYQAIMETKSLFFANKG